MLHLATTHSSIHTLNVSLCDPNITLLLQIFTESGVFCVQHELREFADNKSVSSNYLNPHALLSLHYPFRD